MPHINSQLNDTSNEQIINCHITVCDSNGFAYLLFYWQQF